MKADYSAFTAPGFNGSISKRPEDGKIGDNIKVSAIILIIVIAIIFIVLCSLPRSLECYASTYSIQEGEVKNLTINNGAYVYLAPITSDDAFIGYLPAELHLDVITYIPKYSYKGNGEADAFIGIDAKAFQEYSNEEFRLELDKDGIVWIKTFQAKVTSK